MHVAKNDVETMLQIPGATARLRQNMGEAGSLGTMSAEYFSLAAGVDTTELFQGLEGDLCQCPHWGYMLRGSITTTDARGQQETVNEGDLFYWPNGHKLKVTKDADFVMFSPQKEHIHVIEHLRRKTGAARA